MCYNANSLRKKEGSTINKTIDKVAYHKKLTEEIHDLYQRKNHDYGDSFGRTYEALGIISAATRISDKYNRFVTLAKGNKALVNTESIRDTLIDMANYALMTIIELDNAEQENTNDLCRG